MSNIHLKSVELLADKYSLNKGLKIEFNHVTLLVGEQGCGKSTLLTLLQENSDIIKVELHEDTIKKGINTFYFDAEKMNPRIVDLQMYTNPNGTSRGIGVGAAMQSHFMSHGEVLKEFTVNRIKDTKDCVLYLDEPEAALSLRNQYKLAKEIENAANRNVQLIIATHCLPIIQHFDNVYSLEHHRWFRSKMFIEANNI